MHRLAADALASPADGMVADGGGLVVHTEAGRSTFRFRYQRQGKTRYVTLGRAPDATLSQARERAARCRQLLGEGRDPRMAFELLIEEWVVGVIRPPRLTPDSMSAPPPAAPPGGLAPAARPRRSLRDGHRPQAHAALPWQELPALLRQVRSSPRVGTAVALALEFLVLTAAGTSEVLGAKWDDIDESQRAWRIPARALRPARIVPLSFQALLVLRQAQALGGPMLFPSPQRHGRPLSNMALLTALRRMGYERRTTVHGLRAAFAAWVAARPGADGGRGTIRAVVSSHRLMQAWSSFCTSG